MAGNEKMSSSTGDNNKEVLLRELQKSIHFVKTIGSSHVPNVDKPTCVLALPAWFVKKHGDKFQQTVLLRSGLSTKPWRVQLSISVRHSKAPEVKFGSGWREFSAFHGLIEGDDLLFSLSELSVFDVYVFRETGISVKPSSLQGKPRKRSHDFEVSQDEVQKSGGCRVRHLNARRTDGSKDDSPELFAKKKIAAEEGRFAFHGRSTAGRFTSSNFDLHYLESRNLRDPPTFLCDSHEGQQPPVQEDEELVKPCTGDGSVKHVGARKSNADEDEDMEFEKTRKTPPSFLKRLTASNFFSCKRPPRLEIPKEFVRTYGSGLHPPIVKLQGIHESCLVRIVVCAWKQDGGKSRLYLTDGWREFGDENGLKVGQELSFTLTADSFLVVRVNS